MSGVPGAASCRGTLGGAQGVTKGQTPPTGQPRDLPWEKGPKGGSRPGAGAGGSWLLGYRDAEPDAGMGLIQPRTSQHHPIAALLVPPLAAPQPLVAFLCWGQGVRPWGCSAPPPPHREPEAGGGGMCCSWAEAADAALLEITLLHARRQREKLLSRALSAQPALSAQCVGTGGPSSAPATQPPPHRRHPQTLWDNQQQPLALGWGPMGGRCHGQGLGLGMLSAAGAGVMHG